VLIAALVVMAACAAPESTDQVETAASAEPAESVASDEATGEGADAVLPAAIGERGGDPARGAGNPTNTLRAAMDWTSAAVGGGEINGTDYLGQDVVLWFWAPWCAWCNAEAPRVADAAREFDGQIQFLGMPGSAGIDQLERFVNRHDLHHIDHAADINGEIWGRFDINYQPWWIFINDDGTVIDNWQGRLSDEEIAERIDLLLSS